MTAETLLKPLGDAAGGRFLVVNYVPVLGATGAVLGLFWAGAPRRDPDFAQAWGQIDELSGRQVVVLAIAVGLVAIVVQPVQYVGVRLLEGHWPRWLSPVSARLVIRQKRQRQRLERLALYRPEHEIDLVARNRAGSASTQLRLRYPAQTSLRPTQLGNVLAALDEQAGASHGWDATVAWPRLYPVIGDRQRAIVDERRDTLDALARLAVLGFATGLFAAGLLAFSGWWILLAVIPTALGWLAMRAGVGSALLYAEAVQVCFDLHRFDMMRALHLSLPIDARSEQDLAQAMCDDWRQGAPYEAGYSHPQEL